MTNFKTYFEDFNNWRSPVYAANSGPDIVNFTPKTSVTGFKGAQGLTWQGGEEQLGVKMPTNTKRSTKNAKLAQLLKRIRERKKD